MGDYLIYIAAIVGIVLILKSKKKAIMANANMSTFAKKHNLNYDNMNGKFIGPVVHGKIKDRPFLISVHGTPESHIWMRISYEISPNGFAPEGFSFKLKHTSQYSDLDLSTLLSSSSENINLKNDVEINSKNQADLVSYLTDERKKAIIKLAGIGAFYSKGKIRLLRDREAHNLKLMDKIYETYRDTIDIIDS